jgi:Domain of unknown function (DUF932)
MTVHTTLDTLIERVMGENERKFDLLADTRRMSVETYPQDDAKATGVILAIDQPSGVTSLDLSDHALGQMATDLEIPKRYFDRMKVEAPDLFQTNVHHWLYETPKRKLVRAYKDDGRSDLDKYSVRPDVGRAWLSDRYRRLDNLEIATRLLPEFDNLGTEVTFHQAAITDTKFYLRAVFPKMEGEVKQGDPVQWGVQIRNSEVGDGQFSIDSFVLRLVCINGLVVAKVMSARHVGKRLGENLSDEAIRADDKAFWLAARDELRAALDETRFQEVLASLRETTDGAVITAPIAATERLAKQLSLSDGEKEAVLTQLASNGDFTRWGALNAVTAAAKSSESFDRQVELEELGWSMAEMSEREWGRIAVPA